MAKKSGKAAPKRRPARSGGKQKKTAAQQPVAAKPQQPQEPARLPSVRQLTETTALTLWRQKNLFAGIVLVYGLLNLILVQGFASNTSVGALKTQLNQVFSGHLGSLGASLGAFAALAGSAGNGSSQAAGSYQVFLGIIASLAIIWALRQVLAGAKLRVRDAYYKGMYPLVPFILVLLVLGLQLLPLLVGSLLYTAVNVNGIAVDFLEHFVCALIFGLLALWSLYMLSSSVFALYIVTLADMTPRRALRSARELVGRRRWLVLRKLLCLPVILLAVAAIITVPFIVLLTPLAQWLLFVLTMFALLAAHGYVYTLYRELLNE